MINRTTLTVIGLTTLLAGCGGTAGETSADAGDGATQTASGETAGSGEVSVAMEGSTLSLPTAERRDDMVEDVDGERRYLLMASDEPLSLNFNIKQDAIPSSFPATFNVPADNQPNIKVDLNFFNQDRDSSRMKKRSVFSEGTIEVRAMSENALDISFKGSGHPLGASKDMFPIEGHAKVSW